jgi:hypothetical protein
MRFSTIIVALKRFLQVPLDDTSVNLAFFLLHNQIVFANSAVTFGGYVVIAGECQMDPELIRAIYEFHHPAQSLASVHYLLVPVFHVLFGQALHQLWATPGVIMEVHQRDYLIQTPAGQILLARSAFFFAHVPAFPTLRTTPATTPVQPKFLQLFPTGSAQSSVPDGSVVTSSTSFYTNEAATILLLSGRMDTKAPVNSFSGYLHLLCSILFVVFVSKKQS